MEPAVSIYAISRNQDRLPYVADLPYPMDEYKNQLL